MVPLFLGTRISSHTTLPLQKTRRTLNWLQVLVAGHMKVMPAFFPRLPICLAKMCLVVLRHILELPGHTMVLLCTFQACNGYLVPITSPKCVRHVPKVCLGIIHLFSKKMIWWKADKKKKKQAILLHYLCADLLTCHKTRTSFGMDKEPVETKLQILKVPPSLFESSAQGVTNHYPGVSVAQCTMYRAALFCPICHRVWWVWL